MVNIFCLHVHFFGEFNAFVKIRLETQIFIKHEEQCISKLYFHSGEAFIACRMIRMQIILKFVNGIGVEENNRKNAFDGFC